MNDEIKEILNIINYKYKDYYVQDIVSGDDLKLLSDYITNLQNDLKYQKEMEDEYIEKHTKLLQDFTNLQEENEDLKDRLKVMEHFKNSLQEENEKLKELCDKYEEEHNTAFKLWTMKMEEVPTYEEKMIYKSRCEKAIEFCDYLLSHDEVVINRKKYIKQNGDDIITNAIKSNLLGGDEE